jgi:asparagine synthase (glutamine-hydrolysing)
MADRLPNLGDCGRKYCASSSGALCLNGRPRESYWHVEGDLCVALEGYPWWADRDLSELARQRGHAAALAAAYRARGEALLERLHGAFAFAVVDLEKSESLVAIDRAGIHSVCFAEGPKGTFLFSTTTDSIAAFPTMTATVSPQRLYHYLYFVDRVPAPWTIFAEMNKLAPGEFARFANGRVVVGRYWRMRYSEDDAKGADEMGAEMFGHLRTAVARSLDGEDLGRTGSFLSGGLDSSTVTGLFAERCRTPAKSFTMSFAIDGYDETEYARAAVEKFRTEHREYLVTPNDILDLIPRLAEVYDEPFSNHSCVPAFQCARIAREAGVDLMLAGDGGDELFAGNAHYLSDSIFDRYRMIPRLVRTSLIEPIVALGARAQSAGLARKAANYVRIANMPVPVRMTRANVFARVGLDRVFDAGFARGIDASEPLRFVEAVYEESPSPSAVKKMMHLDLRITLADGDLRKVNRMCELAGVRVRYPFLDDDMVEFSGRVPHRYLIAGGELRAFYKRAARGFLPDKIIEKKKHGFGLPFLEYSDRFRPLLEMPCDVVSTLKSRRIFRTDFLDDMIACHRGAANGLSRGDIWDLMMIELWHQRHVDRRDAVSRAASRRAPVGAT